MVEVTKPSSNKFGRPTIGTLSLTCPIQRPNLQRSTVYPTSFLH